MEEYNQYLSGIFSPRHKKLARKVYEKFPRRVRRKIQKNFINLNDIFYESKNPNEKVSGESLGFYHRGKGIIDIIPKNNLFSDMALMGLIVHETAHAIIDFSFCPIRKLIFKRKFLRLSNNEKQNYILSSEPSEELHANWLGIWWGFAEEIKAMNQERIIIINKNGN